MFDFSQNQPIPLMFSRAIVEHIPDEGFFSTRLNAFHSAVVAHTAGFVKSDKPHTASRCLCQTE